MTLKIEPGFRCNLVRGYKIFVELRVTTHIFIGVKTIRSHFKFYPSLIPVDVIIQIKVMNDMTVKGYIT